MEIKRKQVLGSDKEVCEMELTCNVTKRVQVTQYEPYEVSFSVKKSYLGKNGAEIDELKKMHNALSEAIIESINEHLEQVGKKYV